jgi:FAD-dependent urate hydroxylase
MTAQSSSALDTPIETKTAPSRAADCEVAIVGAGPYGIAAGAFLKNLGIETQVFGKPMEFWAEKMPAGMLLRSPRIASNIADPFNERTLEAFEAHRGISSKSPLPLETFVEYGRWFQQQVLPHVDNREVAKVEFLANTFRLTLVDGSSFFSKRVVIAAGIASFQRIPTEFRPLSRQHVTHCYSGFDVRGYRGKKVAVIGAGQSALESAALLSENGAEVDVIAKIGALRWIGQNPWLHKLGPISTMLYSKHDIGPAGISRLVASPHIMRRIPLGLRDRIRTRAVRPAGSAWLPNRLKNVNLRTNCFVGQARSSGSMAILQLSDGNTISVDHVILGTGYSVDITKFSFLPAELLQRVALFGGYPVLKSGFESTLTGLHFIGATAARSFGPLLYFVTGTEFAARELSSKISMGREVSQ